MGILEFKNVSFQSGDKTILKNISLNIEPSDFISIVGPSGSGKSTFLKLCCHLISPRTGQILYKSKDILLYNPYELRKSIAYCFQMPYLFGNNVYDNLSFPYIIRNLKVDTDKVYEMLDYVKLQKEILKEDIKNLSGGEKQRIALIRTLIFKPEVLLLDEVTSALDYDNTIIVEDLINSINKEGITVLWITHNESQSKKYANKILTIENGEVKKLEEKR